MSCCQNELLVGLLQKKKLKNIILTGNLTWNWCLSFGICQYYSRNMFHCRASWDYDPFTQLVRIPQIHSTLFAAVWEFGASSQKPHHGLYSISIFIKAKTWIWSPKGLVTDSTRQIGFGEEWYVQQRNPGRTMVLVFFCGFFFVPAWCVKRGMSWIMKVNWKTFVICKIWILTHQTWDKVEGARVSTTHLQYSVRGLDLDKLYRLIIAHYIQSRLPHSYAFFCF